MNTIMPRSFSGTAYTIGIPLKGAEQQTQDLQDFSVSMAQQLACLDQQALLEQLVAQTLTEQTQSEISLTVPSTVSSSQETEQSISSLFTQNADEDDLSAETLPLAVNSGVLSTDEKLQLPQINTMSSVYSDAKAPSLALAPLSLLMGNSLTSSYADNTSMVEQDLVLPAKALFNDYGLRKDLNTQSLVTTTPVHTYELKQQADNSALAARLVISQDSNVKSLPASQTVQLKQVLEQNITLNNITQTFNDVADGHSKAMGSLWATNSMTSSESLSQWKSEFLGQNPAQWGQKLLSVLGDKVQLQLGQQLQKAQIRLDPPQLGSVDISISVDRERTTVHLSASNPQVREAMQQTIDQLRQSLGAKMNSEINVTVQADVSEQRQSQHRANSPDNNIIAGQWHEASTESQPTTTEQPNVWLNRLV